MTQTNDAATDTAGQVTLHHHGRVADITVNRTGKLNALTPEMLDELARIIADVQESDASVVVVRGAPGPAFCVGADINRFAGLSPAEMWRSWTVRGHRTFQALAQLRPPTIAVVHGHAFGGGLELALACDFRVAADDARLGLPEVGLGTVPGWGGTERLTELIGRSRAKEIVLARRQVDGATALDWGLVNRTGPERLLADRVQELVESLLEGAPLAIALGKQLIDAAADGMSSAILEPLAGALTATSDDLREGITAFRERRPAAFSGS